MGKNGGLKKWRLKSSLYIGRQPGKNLLVSRTKIRGRWPIMGVEPENPKFEKNQEPIESDDSMSPRRSKTRETGFLQDSPVPIMQNWFHYRRSLLYFLDWSPLIVLLPFFPVPLFVCRSLLSSVYFSASPFVAFDSLPHRFLRFSPIFVLGPTVAAPLSRGRRLGGSLCTSLEPFAIYYLLRCDDSVNFTCLLAIQTDCLFLFVQMRHTLLLILVIIHIFNRSPALEGDSLSAVYADFQMLFDVTLDLSASNHALLCS
jgi:hypothetical protein